MSSDEFKNGQKNNFLSYEEAKSICRYLYVSFYSNAFNAKNPSLKYVVQYCDTIIGSICLSISSPCIRLEYEILE